MLGTLEIVGMNLEPSIDERSNQPRPDSALMIRRITGAKVAIVARLEVSFARCKRTKTYRSQQSLFDDIQHRRPAKLIENWIIQRNRKYLVRPARRILTLPILTVDNIV